MHTYARSGLLLTALASLLACSQLEGVNIQGVDLGRLASAGQHLTSMTTEKTQDEELAIGHSTANMLLEQAPLLDNRALQAYVNRVGSWIAQHSERPDLPWRFGVLDNPAVGAYAAPGGYVFITSGMLAQMDSEAELAGVLAHEIAHCVRKHHLEAIQQQAGVGLLSDLGHVALQAKGANSGASSALGTEASKKVEQLARNLYSRGLDRGDEYEADAMGVVLAARAGYDPYGLATVLQGLSASKKDDAVLITFLKVHPNIGDRLTKLEPVYGYLDGQMAANPSNPQTLAERYRKQVAVRAP